MSQAVGYSKAHITELVKILCNKIIFYAFTTSPEILKMIIKLFSNSALSYALKFPELGQKKPQTFSLKVKYSRLKHYKNKNV
jgi:hypothetical protein